MYATKHLREFKATPEAWQPPPQGPSSGFLIVDDHDEEPLTSCWGFCSASRLFTVRDMPITQNKILTVVYIKGMGKHTEVYTETVLFVPVVNSPLSENRYYVVVAEGKHKGLVHTCSKEEDMMITCCLSPYIVEVEPKPFDHKDIYQQVEIIPHKGQFTAKAVAIDGFPPYILRQKYWSLRERKPTNYQLGEAAGLHKTTRLDYMEINMSSSFIVGKWYCPFIFVKEGSALKDQMQKSIFYEVTLEQFWEELHSGTENKRILSEGKETMTEERESNDGFVWFRNTRDLNGERIGISFALWERIIWDESYNGWKALVQE